MDNINRRGLVQTVLGAVSPLSLGPTMTHEHLLIDFSLMLHPPSEASTKGRSHEPLSLSNLGWIRYNSYSNLDNLLLLNESVAVEEALLFKREGGGTLVEATTIGIGRDPRGLARIARATGLNIIMGAGYYVDASHSSDVKMLSQSQIERQIIEEITVGVADTGIKAGIIGEIGCTWPLTENERKVLGAVARAQLETGAPVLIHPGRSHDSPNEILDLLSTTGADLERVIMGHLDRTINSIEALIELAKTGCYLEWDLFGNESSYYPLSDIDMPSDAQRLSFIRQMTDEGYGDKIVISHDICSKHRLVKYGGHGYGHILENIVPHMRTKGFSEQEIRNIIIDNPSRILTFI